MKKIKRFLGRAIYLLASKLPESISSVNVGQRSLRAFCGRLILTKCGKNVNIEKNAVFASTVEIGDNSGLGINCRIAGKAIIGKNVMMISIKWVLLYLMIVVKIQIYLLRLRQKLLQVEVQRYIYSLA